LDSPPRGWFWRRIAAVLDMRYESHSLLADAGAQEQLPSCSEGSDSSTNGELTRCRKVQVAAVAGAVLLALSMLIVVLFYNSSGDRGGGAESAAGTASESGDEGLSFRTARQKEALLANSEGLPDMRTGGPPVAREVFITWPWEKPEPVPDYSNWKTVLLETAAADKGAVCLDGTPAGFFVQAGWGTGKDRWIIHLQGGAWCASMEACVERSKSTLGSTNDLEAIKSNLLGWYDGGAHGLLSDKEDNNPDFYNWNKVYMHYCDGASYSGNAAEPIQAGNTTIYFRGKRILDATLDELLDAHGMRTGSALIFKGCSAGGLGVWMHCDYVADYVPAGLNTRCVPECGLFMDMPDSNGVDRMPSQIRWVAETQKAFGSDTNLNKDCLAAHTVNPWKCFFGQWTLPYVKTPTFAVNSVHDSYQAEWILGVSSKCFKSGMDRTDGRPNIFGTGGAPCSEREELAMNRLRDYMIGNVTKMFAKDCEDTSGWANGWNCKGDGMRRSQWCTSNGWTCEAYDLWGWCSDGRVTPGKEFASTVALRNPQENCCICGGGKRTKADVDFNRYEKFDESQACKDIAANWSTAESPCATYEQRGWCVDGKPKSGMEDLFGKAMNYPERNCCACGGGDRSTTMATEHGFFLYDCVTHCGYMNNAKWNRLSNGFLTLRQAFSSWYFHGAQIRSVRAAGRNWGKYVNPTCY